MYPNCNSTVSGRRGLKREGGREEKKEKLVAKKIGRESEKTNTQLMIPYMVTYLGFRQMVTEINRQFQ